MAEHKHGSIDATEHQKMFDGFLKFSAWVAGISIGVLLLAALING
ncbi:MAG: aa3-type cytochrome c oxidase subunit IV [Halocynthiibacter sp.]